ncbi:3-hydroxyacyl-CoA dehydrogenase family protein [Alpinimonas psychrophila]|uniref:3-hydroxybutyryl-CoA dehydrogenase n=1 Tax=Alpinimonas psychrophila TaxID=748908 RepID=A0A7W3PNK3_9MICO|nr:3-hydroxyacyl-CoA dehydrogenase NAD-binding domain-containing protein [Alpinimonas psychrophila]MBA8828919.1 3-hydroxybutyryl-CoA dehydrogenase [Alpinimonas psychrophila]
MSTVAVIGGGIMGRGIAAALTAAGHRLTVVEPNVEVSLDGVVVTADLDSALVDADLVIEAVPEEMAVKLPVWTRMGEIAPLSAFLASNTSALDIDALAALVPRPERVLGTHWFNPAQVVPCVEIVRGAATSDDSITWVHELLSGAGKLPVLVRNSPGFVGNRIQFALVREALLCYEEGLASADDIDAIVSSSFGPRLAVLGPLTNADLGGLDTYRSILEYLSSQLGERFSIPDVLERLVEEGRHGVKSGAGISSYDPERAAELIAYRDTTLRRVIAAIGTKQTP